MNKIYVKISSIIFCFFLFCYGLYGAMFNEGIIFKLVSLVIDPWPTGDESFLFFNAAYASIVMIFTLFLISTFYILCLYINRFFKSKP